MSDISEKLMGVRFLPIFPLPLVLLPNELLPLHIFEPRYRQMLKDIESSGNLFGVSHFDSDQGFVTRPEPGSTGCVAEVRDAEMLADGRTNIVTTGLMRYRLLEYAETNDEYLVADVEFFEDEPDDSPGLKLLADRVFLMFKRIARAAHDLSGQRSPLPDIPQSDPETMSFLITAAFNLPVEMKLPMLETSSTVDRLERLQEILAGTVGKMEESAHIQTIARTNGHSKKKVDY